MFYYLYQIRNKVNNKVYVGVHKTKNIDDGYMGSGTVIKSAIEKYGIDNFEKTILEYFDTSKMMYQKEKEVVTEEFLKRDDVYNIRCGGLGGFDHLNTGSQEHIQRAKNGGLIRAKQMLETSNPFSDKKYGKNFAEFPEFQKEMNAKANSEESLLRKRKTFADINHQKGSKNSQFGKCWITHPEFGNKSIKKEFLCEYINQGYSKGRKKIIVN